ncbi:MAG: hypothetical protein R3C40_10850 [Parvularculaceae bacterium]
MRPRFNLDFALLQFAVRFFASPSRLAILAAIIPYLTNVAKVARFHHYLQHGLKLAPARGDASANSPAAVFLYLRQSTSAPPACGPTALAARSSDRRHDRAHFTARRAVLSRRSMPPASRQRQARGDGLCPAFTTFRYRAPRRSMFRRREANVFSLYAMPDWIFVGDQQNAVFVT